MAGSYEAHRSLQGWGVSVIEPGERFVIVALATVTTCWAARLGPMCCAVGQPRWSWWRRRAAHWNQRVSGSVESVCDTFELRYRPAHRLQPIQRLARSLVGAPEDPWDLLHLGLAISMAPGPVAGSPARCSQQVPWSLLRAAVLRPGAPRHERRRCLAHRAARPRAPRAPRARPPGSPRV